MPKKQKKSKGPIVFLFLLILISVTSIMVYRFARVKEIAVQGNVNISAQSIAQMTGIEYGQHIFSVDMNKVENNIARSPYLRLDSYDVSLSGKVTVIVKERVPAAILMLGNSFVVIDNKGNVLKVDTAMDEIKYPVIVGITPTEIQVNNLIKTDDAKKLDIMYEILSTLEKYKLSTNISEVNLKNLDDVRIIFSEGVYIKMGSVLKIEDKIAGAKAAYTSLDKQKRKKGFIDVRYPGEALYSPN